MPLYDFRCGRCGHEFEDLVSVDAPAPACPACGAAEVNRKLTSFAGPFTVGLRGAPAKRSDADRRAREERRREHFAKQREERKQRGDK